MDPWRMCVILFFVTTIFFAIGSVREHEATQDALGLALQKQNDLDHCVQDKVYADCSQHQCAGSSLTTHDLSPIPMRFTNPCNGTGILAVTDPNQREENHTLPLSYYLTVHGPYTFAKYCPPSTHPTFNMTYIVEW